MAPSETPQQIVTRVMYGFLTPGMTYPNTLPADLAPWYCYPADAGHSILAVLTSQVQPGKPVEGALGADARQAGAAPGLTLPTPRATCGATRPTTCTWAC